MTALCCPKQSVHWNHLFVEFPSLRPRSSQLLLHALTLLWPVGWAVFSSGRVLSSFRLLPMILVFLLLLLVLVLVLAGGGARSNSYLFYTTTRLQWASVTAKGMEQHRTSTTVSRATLRFVGQTSRCTRIQESKYSICQESDMTITSNTAPATQTGTATSPNICQTNWLANIKSCACYSTLPCSALLCSASSTLNLFSPPFRHMDATLLYYTLNYRFCWAIMCGWHLRKLMIFGFAGLA